MFGQVDAPLPRQCHVSVGEPARMMPSKACAVGRCRWRAMPCRAVPARDLQTNRETPLRVATSPLRSSPRADGTGRSQASRTVSMTERLDGVTTGRSTGFAQPNRPVDSSGIVPCGHPRRSVRMMGIVAEGKYPAAVAHHVHVGVN